MGAKTTVFSACGRFVSCFGVSCLCMSLQCARSLKWMSSNKDLGGDCGLAPGEAGRRHPGATRRMSISRVPSPARVEMFPSLVFMAVGPLLLLPLTHALDTGGAVLNIQNLDLWAGNKPLLLDVNWQIRPNERWAIVGKNGAGKSTLLKTIAQTKPNDQNLALKSKVRLGFLEQTAVSGSTRSLRDEVMSRMDAFCSAQEELKAAEAACARGKVSASDLQRLETARATFEAVDGYAVDARVSRVLKGIGFDAAEFDRPCDSFSGGWQMRIGLARLLLSEPDFLMLDEPTNHLDASARAWLGEYLSAYSGTIVIVSHDESFISSAVDSIAEIINGRIELYRSTPMIKFHQVRAERARQAISTVEAQEREARRLQDFIDRMGAKASKAKQAKDRQGKLDRLSKDMDAARVFVAGISHRPRLQMASPPACGVSLVELRDVSIRHPQSTFDILQRISLQIERGMRLVVRGPNGAGKSTLVKALAGTLDIRQGERLVDDRLQIGVFAQDLAQELPLDVTALDYLSERATLGVDGATFQKCRSVLGALGLSGEAANRKIGDFSGGEKARVALATFCLTPCNLMLLDEPTNHLDIEAIGALLQAVEDFKGAIVVVSHDQTFCEAIQFTHVATVADGGLILEERELRRADFSQGRGIINSEENSAEVSNLDRERVKAIARDERAIQKRRKAAPKRILVLESKIADAEAQLERIDLDLLKAGSDVELVVELNQRRFDISSSVEALYDEWAELEQMLEDV